LSIHIVRMLPCQCSKENYKLDRGEIQHLHPFRSGPCPSFDARDHSFDSFGHSRFHLSFPTIHSMRALGTLIRSSYYCLTIVPYIHNLAPPSDSLQQIVLRLAHPACKNLQHIHHFVPFQFYFSFTFIRRQMQPVFIQLPHISSL